MRISRKDVVWMPPRKILPIGHKVDSRYEVIRVIGQGGMGAVYQAKDVIINKGKIWALKELAPLKPQPDDLARFQREAEILAQLDHPNLPKVDGYFDDAGKFYLVMDYIEGQDLGKILARKLNGFSERRVKEWLKVLADILYYLHNHKPPVYFRDIKPLNIIIDKKGKLWLVDAGSAIFKPQGIIGSIPTSGITGQKAMTAAIGTPEYCPPEQLHQVDERTDIYNLGATIYHLLTGSLAEPKMNVPIRPVNKVKPGISDEFSAIVRGMTEFNREDRFSSASEIVAKVASGKFVALEYMAHIEDKEMENFISKDKGNKYGFDSILLIKYQGLINYLKHQLHKQAVGQLEELIDCFDPKKTTNIFFSGDPDEEKKRIDEHLIFLTRTKFYLLYRYLHNMKKAEKTVEELVKLCDGTNEMLLMVEFYEAIGNLKKAHEVSEKATKKYSQATEVFEKLYVVETKLENKKITKRLKNTASDIKQKVECGKQTAKRQGFSAYQYLSVGKNWTTDVAHLFTDSKSFSTMMGSVLVAVILSMVFFSWIYHVRDLTFLNYFCVIFSFGLFYGGGLLLKFRLKNKQNPLEAYFLLIIGLVLLVLIAGVTRWHISSTFSWGEKYEAKKEMVEKLSIDMEKPGWGRYVEELKAKEETKQKKQEQEKMEKILHEAYLLEHNKVRFENINLIKRGEKKRRPKGKGSAKGLPKEAPPEKTTLEITSQTESPSPTPLEASPGPSSQSGDFTPTEPPMEITPQPTPSSTNTTASPLEIPSSDVRPTDGSLKIPQPEETKTPETSSPIPFSTTETESPTPSPSPIPTAKSEDLDQITPSKSTPPVFQGGH